MNRAFYLAGWSWVVVALGLVARVPRVREPVVAADPVVTFGASPAVSWFQRVRPHCNAVEAHVRLGQDPPPSSVEGAGFAAACLALAGRIDDARTRILALPEPSRAAAAEIVFGVGHPVADAGDDASAGPIMRLVVEFAPWNFMAQYHAGMSYYGLDEPAAARAHLELFLEAYPAEDGWRRNALRVLERLRTEAGR